MTKYIAIAAIGQNHEIGYEGNLPWSYPEDLEHFFSTTSNGVLVLGYKTFLEFPKSRIERRELFVLSKDHDIDAKGTQQFSSFQLLLDSLEKIEKKQIYVCGGEQVYEMFFRLGLIDEAIITHIDQSFFADRFFPIQYLKGWPSKLEKKTLDFQILRYTNPKGNSLCSR